MRPCKFDLGVGVHTPTGEAVVLLWDLKPHPGNRIALSVEQARSMIVGLTKMIELIEAKKK